MMFVTTSVLLSASVFSRGEAQAVNEIHKELRRLPRRATVPEDNLGMPAPIQGGPRQPCRTGWPAGLECDSGLHCQITRHNGWTSGICLPKDPAPRPPVTPELGGEGEPCRNGDECDWGLHCHITRHGSYTTGVCRADAPPAPSPTPPYTPEMGRQGEPCRNTLGDECDYGLYCRYEFHGQYMTGTCQDQVDHVTTTTGGESEMCNTSGSKCNSADLSPKTYPIISSWPGLVDPTGNGCVCERNNLGASIPASAPTDLPALGSSAPKLGNCVGCAPQMGGEGEPCRNYQCNYGLYCKVTGHGTYTTGQCQRFPSNRGHEGEPCNLIGSGQPVCYGTLVCRETKFYPSGSTELCVRPNRAAEGERCGSYANYGQPTICQDGLICKKQKLMGGSGYMETCEQRQQPSGAGLGELCGASAHGRQCQPGLWCRTQHLLGGSGYSSNCAEPWVGGAQAPGN